jgi:hypothetical protein
VVFTAADDDSIHCLRLRDGKLLWQTARKDDLYLAGVHDGKVLLVGAQSCRALRLADGQPLWSVAIGVPSGQGVAIGDSCYLVPLQRSARTRQPGICALDLKRGARLGEVCAAEAPGNLLFCKAGLVSQQPLGIAVYPELKLWQIPDELTLTDRDLERLWTDLESSERARAGAAGSLLMLVPEQTVRMLKGKMRPVRADDARIALALEDLDDAQFAVRERARREMENFSSSRCDCKGGT